MSEVLHPSARQAAPPRSLGQRTTSHHDSGKQCQRDPPDQSAMIELGRAQKTIFLARYLRSRTLQREIHQGLNVVESWNRAISVILYGKNGDLATNRRDD
jgi:TnpA family transposase